MSPDAKREFETQWCLLERRARSFLSRKRVPVCDQEDLLQEAAVRLLRMWDTIDQGRPLWPLTSTILLNLLRDRSRGAPRHEIVASIPEQQAPHDVERLGLARLELDRVRRAMGQLSTSHRSILMQELEWSESTSGSPADKMLRMRARRKLRSILEKVSGLVVLRSRRVADLLDKVVALREGAATTASCVLCLMLGVGGAIVTPPALTPEASAAPTASSPSFDSSTSNHGPGSEVTEGAGATLRESVAEARRAQQAARQGSPSREARKARSAEEAAGQESGSLLPSVPVGDGDGPAELPQPSPAVSDPSAPTIPSDPGDDPTVEPPSPPGVPTPPLPAIPAPPTGAVTDEVEQLL